MGHPSHDAGYHERSLDRSMVDTVTNCEFSRSEAFPAHSKNTGGTIKLAFDGTIIDALVDKTGLNTIQESSLQSQDTTDSDTRTGDRSVIDTTRDLGNTSITAIRALNGDADDTTDATRASDRIVIVLDSGRSIAGNFTRIRTLLDGHDGIGCTAIRQTDNATDRSTTGDVTRILIVQDIAIGLVPRCDTAYKILCRSNRCTVGTVLNSGPVYGTGDTCDLGNTLDLSIVYTIIDG